MNLNSLDLNLLVALDALLREASVSRAAMRIGLSQPAASHALQRLRDLIGDPLLVRTGARMELTLRAQGLRGPLTQALEQVRGLFTRDEFDAARSERHFRLMMPDLAVELLVPPLMEKVTKLAPNVRPSSGGSESMPASLHSEKITCIDSAVLSYGLLELLCPDVKRRLLAIHRRDMHGEECGHCITLYWGEDGRIGAVGRLSHAPVGRVRLLPPPL